MDGIPRALVKHADLELMTGPRASELCCDDGAYQILGQTKMFSVCGCGGSCSLGMDDVSWPPLHPIEIVLVAGTTRSLCTTTPVSGGYGGALTPVSRLPLPHPPYTVLIPHLDNFPPFLLDGFARFFL